MKGELEMFRVEIVEYREEEMENAGCNNGNYPEWAGLDAETGDALSGDTCRCHSGCSGTDQIEFENGKIYLVIKGFGD
jgi:hypothetical protein